MSQSDFKRWNAKYAAKLAPQSVNPDEWLVKHIGASPPGRALELACGIGHNAIWLAQQGWKVEGVDVSSIGLLLANELSRRVGGSAVTWIMADLDDYEPRAAAHDLVVVFRFLDRQRVPELIEQALRPGGTLVYETFSRAQMARENNHLKNADFTLAPGELPTLFPGLTVVEYEEVDLSDRCVARLVARKR